MTWIVAALVGIPLWVWAASWLGNSKQAERMADRMVEVTIAIAALPFRLAGAFRPRDPMHHLRSQRLGRWNAPGVTNAKRPSLKVVQP